MTIADEKDKSPDWKGYGWDQIAVEKLVRTKWGDKAFEDPQERAARLMEEAVELLQAEAEDRPEAARAVAHRIVDMVFDKKSGQTREEASGVIVTLLAFCALKEYRLDELAAEEIKRLTPIDPKVLKDRHNAKADKGVALRAE